MLVMVYIKIFLNNTIHLLTKKRKKHAKGLIDFTKRTISI